MNQISVVCDVEGFNKGAYKVIMAAFMLDTLGEMKNYEILNRGKTAWETIVKDKAKIILYFSYCQPIT